MTPSRTPNPLERIARQFGPVEVHFVPENEAEDMGWTVQMVNPRRIVNRCGIHGHSFDHTCRFCLAAVVTPTLDWHDHDHGPNLEDTARGLLKILEHREEVRSG